ncbi:DUF1573 domain-containing protein [Reichenbachiella versicolor]|uniref:DUF1573 domain-containing protein n=1 Tax=Reichenbachiella versicolor TaxID=1821036 RepID=UPI000D6E3667|nr:DUF1573 domain-containing protein [Reichenbachiella versicolor]
MKKIFLLFAMVSIAASVNAQSNDGAVEFLPPGPHIKFSIESHDFGDITQGDKVSYTFEFTNDGDAPLILSNVKTTCGCTAPSWPREPIMPGTSSKIDVTFNSTGKIGHTNKVITIMSNASNNPETVKIVTNILPKTSETDS